MTTSTQINGYANSGNRESSWSFRDPGGRLISINGRVLRLVHPAFSSQLAAALSSRTVQQLTREHKIVTTEANVRDVPAEVEDQLRANPGATLVEHEAIWFPSFPHEWAPEMLYAAGELTLDVAEAIVADGLGLKDGTPFNILFRGSRPVFIDVLSIETRDSHDPVWLPYAQFVRTFLLPLLANRYSATPLSRVFTVNREGLEPEDVYRSVGWSQRMRPSYLGLVTLPTWFTARTNPNDDSIYRAKRLNNSEQAQFVLRGILRKLRKRLRKLQPPLRKSAWSGYTEMTHYSEQQTAAKLDFVQAALNGNKNRVLDVGCNTGIYSLACARKGAQVVALDYDPGVVGRLWRQASKEQLHVLPLCVNLAQPTPALGWRNQECRSFLDRACGKFDTVLMLAVIHHLLVTERVPLLDILGLAAELTRQQAIIEFVPNTDPMFRRLLRGRESLHQDYTQEVFEQACSRFFRIVRKQQLGSEARCLYLLEK
jgi:SAM-dependent methyltransferase